MATGIVERTDEFENAAAPSSLPNPTSTLVAMVACNMILLVMLAACSPPAHAQELARGFLDSPSPGSFQSGVGTVAGWHCTAAAVTVSFDGGAPTTTAYGTPREDTRPVCGKANTGFGLLFNWNALGNGSHVIRVLADGIEFASASFTVTTLGTEFLRGASGTFTLDNFPQPGRSVTARWQESVQNFVIVGATGNTPGLESGWYVGETDQGTTCSHQTPCFVSFYIAPTLDKLAPSPLVLDGSPCAGGTSLAFNATCRIGDTPNTQWNAVCAPLPITNGRWEYHSHNTHIVASCAGGTCTGTLSDTIDHHEFLGPSSCSTGDVRWTATFSGQH